MSKTDSTRPEPDAADSQAARRAAEVEAAEADPGAQAGPEGAPILRRRLARLTRLLRYRLVIPIARGRHDGVPTARGTAIGLAFGLTPTVGIQMPMILVFWTVVKWIAPRWRFNLIVALAWTWITNVVTAPAYYYLCLITGRLMMGEGAGLRFQEFRARIDGVLSQDAGVFQSFWIYTVEIFGALGLPLFLGCVPWVVVGTWAGYVLTLKLIAKLHTRQRKQMLKRHAQLARRRAAQSRARQAQ